MDALLRLGARAISMAADATAVVRPTIAPVFLPAPAFLGEPLRSAAAPMPSAHRPIPRQPVTTDSAIADPTDPAAIERQPERAARSSDDDHHVLAAIDRDVADVEPFPATPAGSAELWTARGKRHREPDIDPSPSGLLADPTLPPALDGGRTSQVPTLQPDVRPDALPGAVVPSELSGGDAAIDLGRTVAGRQPEAFPSGRLLATLRTIRDSVAPDRPRAGEEFERPPTVRVTIGRIEVRSVPAAAAASPGLPQAPARVSDSRITLAEYLSGKAPAVSNALAIASVTAVMKNLLDNGLIDDQVTSTVGHVHVTALAPDLISIDKNAESQLNLFLDMVTPNAAWRNDRLPSRDAQGDRRTNPPLALDLHYLVTAYASKDLHAEILLGYAMQLLHETPVLPRAGIRRALAVPGLIDDPTGTLPPELEALVTSGLAEQVEAIKVTPDSVGPEELAKLWAGFQSRYRPSASYLASVVLIEAEKSTRAPLPVRARRAYVVPFEQPVIDRVLAEETIGGPIAPGLPVLARYRLVLRGRGLRGDVTLVRIGGEIVAPDLSLVSDTQIIMPLPAGLEAGIQSAQVVHDQLMGEPPVPHVGVVSNLAPFVLHPEIVAPITIPVPGHIRVTIDPPVQERQRVVLLLNERVFPASPPSTARPRAYTFVPPLPGLISPGGPLRDVDVPFHGVTPGEYLVRIAVDGAESPLTTDPVSGAYDGPTVTIP